MRDFRLIWEQERDSAEDSALLLTTKAEDIPTSLTKVKNHPLYVIEKHLLKYEGIYPKRERDIVGTIVSGRERERHNVYPRSHVHLLHTEDRWMRECRKVKESEREKPYKRVKKLLSMAARRKRHQMAVLGGGKGEREMREREEKADLYGIWQTDLWRPPAAKGGTVPRGSRNNVELWTEKHLPEGCVHLNLPRISLACRKLKIDYAPAMTGFEVGFFVYSLSLSLSLSLFCFLSLLFSLPLRV